jgi:hypothetical protein
MPKTIRIKPRRGVILAGNPATGADVPAELAEEWIAARLATRVEEPKVSRGKSLAKPAAEG